MSIAEPRPLSPRARSGAVDAVRVLGILAVVAGHVWNTPVTRELFYPWHVPVFFFLSGYLLRPKSLRDEWTARWRSLGRPYLCWLIAFVALVVVTGVVTHTLHPRTFTQPLYGGAFAVRPFTTFWFVSVLLATALLHRIVVSMPRWVEPFALVVALGAGVLFGRQLATTPLSLGSALACLPFLIAGAAARRIRPRIERPGLVGISLLVVLGVVIVTRLSGPVNLKAGDYGVPVVGVLIGSAISFGLLLVAESVLKALPQRISQITTALAAPGLVVVLVHPVLLWALHAPAVGTLAEFLLLAGAPWALGLLLVRTPAAGWLAGVAATPRASVRRT